MKSRLLLIIFLTGCYFISVFIISEFVSLIGIPMSINQVVTLHSGQTFHHLFLLSDVRRHSAILYTVNNAEEFSLVPGENIHLSSGSDFLGTIHVVKISNDTVQLDFHLRRDNMVEIVIYLVSFFLVIPLYLWYGKATSFLRQWRNQFDN